jgi:hypothetical protein
MNHFSLPRLGTILIAGMLFSACQNQNSAPVNSIATTGDSSEAVPVAGADLRPDALNPVNDDLEFPAGWKYRLDTQDDGSTVGSDSLDTVWFVTMKPGWHIRVGKPRLIVYHPANTAEGTFTASTSLHLFDPGRRNEAYGLILGGRNLDTPDQSYLYFLIRRSGEFLIKQRTGQDTSQLVGWTASDAIVPYTEETDGTASNILSVVVSDDEATFSINGQQVSSLPGGDLNTDGIVGLRFNHGINAHIESLSVTEDPK